MQVIKIFDASVEKASGQEGVLNFTLTERVKDRDGDIIEPKGVILDYFVKNPVFLWAHDLKTPPIGRVIPESIKVGHKRITASIQFDMKDPFAAEVYRKYKDGFMNAGSIRFNPHKYEYIKDEETNRITGVHFKEWELLEFSAVPVPANQLALSRKEIDDDPVMLKIFDEFEDVQNLTCEGWIKSLESDDLKSVDSLCETGQLIEDITEEPEPEDQKDFDGTDWTASQDLEDDDDILPTLKEIVDYLETHDLIISEDFHKELQQAVNTFKKLIPLGKEKGVVPFKATPKADENTAWDANAAIKRIRTWASGGGDFDLSKASVRNKFKQAFAYFDGDGTKQGDYKLPHHDVQNGQLVVVWRGVAAAMAALLGARGGVSLPAGAKKSVYNHLVKHYKQFDKEPPEFKGMESLDDQNKFMFDLILQDDGLREELVNEVVQNLLGENEDD